MTSHFDEFAEGWADFKRDANGLPLLDSPLKSLHERTKGRQAGADDRYVQLNDRPDESTNIEPCLIDE